MAHRRFSLVLIAPSAWIGCRFAADISDPSAPVPRSTGSSRPDPWIREPLAEEGSAETLYQLRSELADEIRALLEERKVGPRCSKPPRHPQPDRASVCVPKTRLPSDPPYTAGGQGDPMDLGS